MKAVTEAIMQLTTERDRIDMAIKALGHLNNFADANLKPPSKLRAKGKKRAKRHFSAAAREKMRLAQKKRWAKWHREQGAKRG